MVCVSGGPDSVFLLHALLHLKKSLDIEIFVANMDHGIRGNASSEDSAFVRLLAAKHSIDFFYKKIQFKKHKKHSIEETARDERYRFFNAVAAKNNINKIATAHTADDLAETVLMRIIKGTSLKGIIGIPPKRMLGKVECVRPVIEIEKKELLCFLKSQKIRYRIDKSNRDNKHFRNTVRNIILPYLSRYNPRLKRSLVNLAESLREDKEFIDSEKQRLSGIVSDGGDNVLLPLKEIAVQPKAMQKEIARDALTRAGTNIKKLTYRHWKGIHALIKLGSSGKSLDLPGGIRMMKNKRTLVVKRIPA